MSDARIPARPNYGGGALSQEALVARRQALRKAQADRLSEVDRLARAQQQIGDALSAEMQALQAQGLAVEALEQPEAGFLDALVRRLTRRRQLLARRSATELLLNRYEAVSTRLRRASAFTDDLRLTTLRLHEEVQGLHDEAERAHANGLLSAARILELEQRLAELERAPQTQRARMADDLTFEMRHEGQMLTLFRSAESLCREQIGPARGLRDTVQRLHEEMQSFVLAATGTVDSAGRRIQALGVAADAPLVVAELQESLHALKDAMQATESYLEHTRDLIAHTLPELSARIAAEAELDHVSVQNDLDAVGREQARAAAERALREEAEAEIERLGRR